MKVALAVAALTGFVLCAIPLLGLYGIESAIVLGALLPPFVAYVACREVRRIRSSNVSVDALSVLGSAMARGLFILAVPLMILGMNMIRTAPCDVASGVCFILLGPVLGVLVASTMGVFFGVFVAHSRRALSLAILFPIFSIAYAFWNFWSTPGIFAYGHFFGYFPGTLYDEEVLIPSAYLIFRVVSILLLMGLSLLVWAAWDPALHTARWHTVRARLGRAGLGLILLLGVAGAEAHATSLGYGTSTASMAEALGASYRGKRCTVHVPRELTKSEARRLLSDCDFHLRNLYRLLGVLQHHHVDAFFFRSAEEKQALMGAGRTFIAKPWRHEVYVQLRPWPHPVLPHELAHIVAGDAAHGPLRVSGDLGGWIPNPAIIEGVAVALAWEGHDDFTAHEWTKALLAIQKAPHLGDLFGLRFWTHASRDAYTVAGSFFRYLLDARGSKTLRDVYFTGDIHAATGKTLDELEREWLAYLDTLSISDRILDLARERYMRTSIFSRVCPHMVAHLESSLAADVTAADDARAAETCEEILRIDSSHLQAKILLLEIRARKSGENGIREAEKKIRALNLPKSMNAAAMQVLADTAFANGATHEASRLLQEILSQPQTEDAARVAEVRLLALESDKREGKLVFDIFGSPFAQPSTPATVVSLARDLSAIRADGLGAYLESRQLIGELRWDLALHRLREARRRGLSTERLRRELDYIEALAAFAVGDSASSRKIWTQIASDPSESRKAEARQWLMRTAME